MSRPAATPPDAARPPRRRHASPPSSCSTCAATAPNATASSPHPWWRRSPDTIARGEQAMLFLNRRGYAPMTLCRACGHRLACPNCTAWLVEAPRPAASSPATTATTASRSRPPAGLRRRRQPRRDRSRHRAHHRGSSPPAARSPHPGDGQRHPARPGCRRRRRPPHRRARDRPGDRTQIVAKGWHFPHLTLVVAWWTPISASPGATSAPRSAPCSCSTRSGGRAGRAAHPAASCCRPTRPSIP